MGYIGRLVFSFSLVILSANSLAEDKEHRGWFENKKHSSYISRCLKLNNQPEQKTYLWLAYGSAKTFEGARTQAFQELATSIQVRVGVSSESHQVYSSKKGSQTDFSEDITLNSSVELQEAEQVCRDDNDPNGLIHVLYQLDRRTPVQKLAVQLRQQLAQQGPSELTWIGPKLLTQSAPALLLQSQLSNPSSTKPIRLPLQLQRSQASTWQLTAGNAIVSLSDRQLFEWLNWSSLSNSSELRFDAVQVNDQGDTLQPTVRYNDGDSFKFRLSGKQGFVTLFNVYPDGRVAQLTASTRIEKNKVQWIPEEGLFETQILLAGETARDWYVGVLTQTPLRDANFKQLQADSGLVSGSSSFQLDQFIRWLDQTKVQAVSGLMIETLPRQ